MNARVKQWVRPEIRELHAYHVPNSHGLIKLDAMENPYQWPHELTQSWLDRVASVSINRYPDPGAVALKRCIRDVMGVPAGADIMLGNGSDEIIQIIAMAVSGPSRSILAPEPTFVMYRMIAAFCGMHFHSVPLKSDFSLDVTAMLEAIEREQPAVVFLSYPNNPSGNLFSRTDVERIIRETDGLVVIDEAYHAFAEDSFLSDVLKYDNVVVMRTVSKMGLAGLRLGFLAGSSDWLVEFEKIRLPYNINSLTQVSAEFALEHQSVFDAQTQQICRDRKELMKALSQREDLHPYPSQTNFILFKVPEGSAARIFDSLKRDGILIKNMSAAGGMLADCLRVTIGKKSENSAFLKALDKALAEMASVGG